MGSVLAEGTLSMSVEFTDDTDRRGDAASA
jgi:hypothetical protein